LFTFLVFFIAYIIVNAIFAIPVAYVAASKGRSAAGFFFLSFFFSFIVGILVVLAIPKFESKAIVSTSGVFARKDSESLFKCPNCAEWVKAEAKVCRFCGKDISTAVQSFLAQEKKNADKEQKELEERARESQKLKELQKQKLRALFRNPLVIGLSSILVVAVVAAIAMYFVNMAAERQALSESKSDWTALAKSCEGELEASDGSDTYQVRNSGSEIVLNVYSVLHSEFLECLGGKIAIDAEFRMYDNLAFTLFEDGSDAWSSGRGLVRAEYGNLSVVAERVGENEYIVTIKKKY
jgi:hypothetical protein